MATPKKSDNVISNILDSLKEKIFGKDIKSVSDIDSILGSVPDKLLSKSAANKSELMKDLISKNVDSMSDAMFKKVSPDILHNQENKQRIYRYNNSDQVTDSIPYCSRALGVLAGEIVSPDNITKQSVQILGVELYNSGEDSETNTKFENLNAIKKNLKVDDSIYEIVENTLRYGDCFVEVIDIESVDIPLHDVVFMEGNTVRKENDNSKSIDDMVFDGEYIVETDGDVKNEKKKAKLNVSIDTTLTGAEKSKNDKNNNKYKKNRDTKKDTEDTDLNLSRLRLMKHHAAMVIKIQSRVNKLCLGYLIAPFTGELSEVSGSERIRFGVNGVRGGPGTKGGVDDLYGEMIKYIAKASNISTNDINMSKSDFDNVIKRLVYDYEKTKKGDVKFRYVPESRMEHFKLGDRFFPYGESIFHKTMFQAKMLIALQSANTMKRLSDATDKRAIYFEVGQGLSRKERNFIETIKEEMRKKKYSLDSLGNIASIPSSINSYEDWFIPQKNGTKMVEVDTIPKGTDSRAVADELKFFRDVVVASLDVPPSYIGLEENTPNKNTLSHESALFARTVITYQKVFSKHLHSMFSKVNKLITNTPMIECIITLPTPQALMLESNADKFETAARIVETLTGVGVPKEFAVKRYFTLDWPEIEKSKTEEKLQNSKETETDVDESIPN